MGVVKRFLDVRNTVEGKVLAVFMSIVLVFSFTNLSAYAADDASKDASGASDPTEVADTGEGGAVPEQGPAAQEAGDSGSADEQPSATEPIAGTDPEPVAPEEQAPAADTATVQLDLGNAYLVYLDQTVSVPVKTLEVPAGKALDLEVRADEGFSVSSVKAVVNGVETEIERNGSGRYVFDAALVTSALTIAVETEAVETTEDSTVNAADPITSDTIIAAGGENESASENEATGEGEPEAPETTEPQPVETVDVVADVSNPAFEGYAYVGNVIVKVTAAEGVLPEGTTVQASRVEREDVLGAIAETVEEQGKVLQDAVAIDVTLLDKDGNAIQPEAPVNVCFFDANVEGDEIGVYRVSDDASTVEAIGARQADTSVQSFDVDHFTIYVAYGWIDAPTQNNAYKVVAGDSVSLWASDRVKNGSWRINQGKDCIEFLDYDNGYPPTATVYIGSDAKAGKVICVQYGKNNDWQNFYITVAASSEKHTVTWYVNGQASKQTTVSDGEQPTYGGIPSRGLTAQYVSFAGWATAPNSKSSVGENELPAVTGDVSYYASFTVKTYFYFVLEGKSNTSKQAKDYMYAGVGTMLVPDSFYNGSRWYDGSDFSINDFIVSAPTDADIRRGIAAHYADYSSDWAYSIDWTTLSIASGSVNYSYYNFDPGMSMHTDGAIQIDKQATVGVTYNTKNPDGSVVTNSTTHNKKETFELNSTVDLTRPAFMTDGYSYDSHETYNGLDYVFDGWYTDQSYTTKAPDSVALTKSATYYARYLANTKTLIYDANGGVFADGTSDPKSTEQQVGKRVTFIDAPTKEGAVFTGWLDEENQTLYPVGSSGMTMPDRNVTLVAQWEVVKATVSVWFYPAEGDSDPFYINEDNEIASTGINKHSKEITLANKEGYSESDIRAFSEEAYGLRGLGEEYWYFDLVVHHKGDPENQWSSIDDISSYDVQHGDDIRYHVVSRSLVSVSYSFVSDTVGAVLPDGVIDQLEDAEVTTAYKHSSVSNEFADAEYADVEVFDHGTGALQGTYTFIGWDKDIVSDVTGDVVFYGSWTYEPADYAVTYAFKGRVPAGHEAPGPDAVKYGQSYTVDATYYQGMTVTDETGTYTFGGWDSGDFVVSGDKAIGGTWTYDAAEYNVTGTIDNGGTVVNGDQIITYGGSSLEVLLQAADGYRIVSITVNGANFDVQPGETRYVFDSISEINQNYIVDVKTVALGAVAVLAPSGEKVYDGTPLVAGESIIDGLPEGFSLTGEVSGTQTDVGSSTSTVSGVVILDESNNDVTANFSVEIVEGLLTVSPAAVVVTADSLSKITGTDDPALTYTVTGGVNGEVPGFTGALDRARGETAGDYAIGQGTLAMADNGAFDADNYTMQFVPGTLTITATTPAPLPTPTPTTPPTDAPAPTPTPGVPPADSPVAPVVEVLQGIVEAVIGEDDTPLAGPTSPAEDEIADDETPLATFDYVHCWVHYYLILGIVLTLLYGAGVLVRRIRFTGRLAGYERDVLGIEDEPAAQPVPAPVSNEGKGA